MRAIKIGADGALGSRGAALLEPYSDEPGTTGLLTTPPDEVYAQTLAASKAGFQTCIHAIGDRANRVTMDVFERVQREVPAARALRMRNEHAQILDAAEIPRFKALERDRLDAADALHLGHAVGADAHRRRAHGRGRLRVAQADDAGARIASGSDFPVEEPNPMLGFYAAITRQDVEASRPGAGRPTSG